MRADKRRVATEVLVLYAGGLLVLLGAELAAGLGGVVAANLGAFVAAYFLLVPVAVLRWRGKDPAAFGIHGRALLASARTFVLAACIVFPPYVLAYEAWSRTVYQRSWHVPEHPFSYFPADLRGRPASLSRPGLYLWVERDMLWAVWTGPGVASFAVQGCACPARRIVMDRHGRLLAKGPAGRCRDRGGGLLEVEAGTGTGTVCNVDHAETLSVTLSGTKDPRVYTGAVPSAATSGRPVVFHRTPLWLFELLLLHLVVVAVPEEVFYRGYVQTRLAPLFRRRWRVLGVPMGWHVVLASILFALSHLVSIPSPFRLAVFFPGLLFGYLRERTGGVVAPALLHASSNVLLAVLVRFH